MISLTDDELIDEFFAVVKHDDQVKQQFALALRTKNEAGLRQAVTWVIENLIKPGVKAVWDGVIKEIVDWLRRGF
jgi:hypothetical protein